MTAEEEKELKTSEPTATHSETEPAPSKTENTSKLTGLALIVAAISIALTLYNAQADRRINKQLLSENRVFAKELKQLQDHQTNVQEQIQSKTGEVQQVLQDKIDSLTQTLHKAVKQSFYQNQDWLLIKTRYYLELAQINAHWSQDNATTITMLQEADLLLAQSNTPSVYGLRQALAGRISELKTIPTLDTAGLLSQLDALKISVNALNHPIHTSSDSESTNRQENKGTSWKTEFRNSLNRLQKLVLVRRVEDPFEPLMSPLYKSLLIESVQLNLQEAQWAVLNKNTKIYQFALNQAIEHLKSTFKTDAPETIALIKQIKELQQVKLIQAQPNLEEPLTLLNQLIDTKESINTKSSKGVKGAHP